MAQLPESFDAEVRHQNNRGQQRIVKAAKIPDEQWDAHKETIQDLYIEQNMKLEDLMKHMTAQYDFKASEQQYRIQFTKWELRKNKRRLEKRPADPIPDHPRQTGPQLAISGPSQLRGYDRDGPLQNLGEMDDVYTPQWHLGARQSDFGVGPSTLSIPDAIPGFNSPFWQQRYLQGPGLLAPSWPPYQNSDQFFTQTGAYYPPEQQSNIINIFNPKGSWDARQLRAASASAASNSVKQRQAIHQAVQAGSLRAVMMLLEADPPSAHILTSDGINTVWIAAQQGFVEILRLLVTTYHVDVNNSSPDGKRTPIHQAAQGGHLRAVELLLENNAEADPTDSHGITPLWSAAQQGHCEVARLLLQHKASIEVESFDGCRRPIHQAAQSGHLEVVKLLLAEGADPNPKDDHGITPLWSAAQAGHHEVVIRLLEEDGVNVKVMSYDGSRQPIHQAAQKGHLETVKALLDGGATGVPEKTTFEDTIPSPFSLACLSESGDVEVVKLLFEQGADIEYSEGRAGKRPIHGAAYKGHVSIMEFLIDKKCNIDATEESGWTALMFAAQEGRLEAVDLLLERGANVNAEEKDGATALWIASQQGHTAIVQKLLAKGAKQLATKASRRRPIHQAAQNGHLSVVRMLLKATPEHLNEEDESGATPLMLATQKNKPEHLAVTDFLVSKGAKISV